MSEIGAAFEACRSERRAAFIPYLCGGDPDPSTSADLLRALVAGGADLVGVGVPFTHPILDGAVTRRATERALAAGATLSAILRLVARHRHELEAPIVLFTYYNPIHRRGAARFAEQAESSGVDGVVCLDLPPEEGEELSTALAERGVDLSFLLAPTTSRRRLRRIDDASRGFVYYLSRTGVTGTREHLPSHLLKRAKRLRRRLRLPLAVGFGLSSAEQIEKVAAVADGVVVGSALVERVEELLGSRDLPARLEEEVRRLRAGIEP